MSYEVKLAFEFEVGQRIWNKADGKTGIITRRKYEEGDRDDKQYLYYIEYKHDIGEWCNGCILSEEKIDIILDAIS